MLDSTFRIGRVAGIEIGAHWTWLIIFGLIVWSLAGVVFPETNPGLGSATYVAMAAAAALVFFVSLLLHELGHAIQALREGMKMEGITLWLLGGVAKFSGTLPSAGAEFRIAVAGPVVTLVLALAFGAVAALPLPSAVGGVVSWLAYINFLLLVFNLLPALPLDGGRIARAAIWHLRRDFGVATRVSAGLGRGFGYLLIAGGLVVFALVGAVGGLWLAFIGWFLIAAASAEAQYATTRGALADLRVEDLMVREPVAVGPEMTLREFVDGVFLDRRHVSYPVVRDGDVLGLISVGQVLEVPAEEWDRQRVEQRMAALGEVLTLPADRTVSDALAELSQSKLQRALVCDGRRLRGLLSLTDVSRALSVLTADRRAKPGEGPGYVP